MLRGADFLRKLRTETQTQSRVFASNPKSFVRLGGLKPSDVTVFRGRATNRDLNLSYTRLVDHFGAPAYNYAVVPLRHSDFTTGYRTGYRDGFHDGYREGRHEPFHRHRSVFSISLFFGGYYNDPSWGFFWNPGYYPAAYAYYG